MDERDRQRHVAGLGAGRAGSEVGGLCAPPPLWARRESYRAVAHKYYLWPRDMSAATVAAGVWCYVDVRFLGGAPWQRLKVAQIVTGEGGWNRACGVQFRFSDALDAPVRIAFEPGASWSHPGNYGVAGPYDQPTMNFGWLHEGTAEREWRRVVLHEMGHALALQHEHEFPGTPIPWNYPALYAYYWRTARWDRATVDAQVLTPLAHEVALTTHFDPKSIMMYAIPREVVTDPTWAQGSNYALSEGDIAAVQTWYGPPPAPPAPPKPPAPPQPEPEPEPPPPAAPNAPDTFLPVGHRGGHAT